MSEIRYHIEILPGNLTKIVFEDGYTPYQHGTSMAVAMRDLNFRAMQKPHDLDVLDAARTLRFSRYNPQTIEETEKPTKRSKRKVADNE